MRADALTTYWPGWRTAEQIVLATLEYVDWFNHRRLYETWGDILPAELENAYYRQMPPSPRPARPDLGEEHGHRVLRV